MKKYLKQWEVYDYEIIYEMPIYRLVKEGILCVDEEGCVYDDIDDDWVDEDTMWELGSTSDSYELQLDREINDPDE